MQPRHDTEDTIRTSIIRLRTFIFQTWATWGYHNCHIKFLYQHSKHKYHFVIVSPPPFQSIYNSSFSSNKHGCHNCDSHKWKSIRCTRIWNASPCSKCGVTKLCYERGSLALFPGLSHFCLPFAFTIIHGSGGPALCSRVLLWTQTEGKNVGGLEMRLGVHMCFVDVWIYNMSAWNIWAQPLAEIQWHRALNTTMYSKNATE